MYCHLRRAAPKSNFLSVIWKDTIESCITNVLLEAYKKGAVANEGSQQRGVALEPAMCAARAGHEGLHIERGPVGQGRSLQVAPGVFF